MNIAEIKDKVLASEEYRFLRTNEHLNDRLVVLGLGGSYAYGTNQEGSDLDIRGAAINSREEILLGQDFGQVVENATDTTVYSVNKLLTLLAQNNPNTIEILGLTDDQLVLTTPTWEKVRANKNLFLSKKVIDSFGGYANAQLRRLDTKSARATGQKEREEYIIGSIINAENAFKLSHARMENDSMKLYTDVSEKEDFEREIFIDLNLTHYPFRDFASLINEYHAIIRGYDKIGKRSLHAIEHGKLGKHMMHLVRLYYMCFDILEKHEFITYRSKEHDLLMDIRNGKYLNADQSVRPEFYDFVDSLDKRLRDDSISTTLPEDVDWNGIRKLQCEISEAIVMNRSF